MQHTPPRGQEPLGRPPNKEHMAPGEQIPDSPLGEVQLLKVVKGLSKLGFKEMGSRLLSPANGLLSVVPDAPNLLLKRPALMMEAPKALMPNRPSA